MTHGSTAELGDKVKDLISGIEGTVVYTETSLQRCNRVAVHIKKKKGNEGAGLVILYDRPQVRVIKKGFVKPEKIKDTSLIQLGDLVKDLITGIEGVAVAREEYLFRCDRISVQPVSKNKKTADDIYNVDAQTLKVIKKAHVTLKDTSEPQKQSGCKMERRSAY